VITLVLTNDHLFGCKWTNSNNIYEIENVAYHAFSAPLTSKIADENQLNHQISESLRLCSEDFEFSGETVQIVLDDDLLLQDVIAVDSSLPAQIPNHYIKWHKEVTLCDSHEKYAHCVTERPSQMNEQHVTYYPKLLPDILKLSIRELGGYPSNMTTLSNALIDGNTLSSSMIVFDTLHGYVIYGKTPIGTFLSDLKFLNGLPKFSNWAGNLDIRDTLFTPEYPQEKINVRFVGSFTDNKKSHWSNMSYFEEILNTDTIHWRDENQKEILDYEQTSKLIELICCSDESITANLYDSSNQFLYEDDEDLIERKKISKIEKTEIVEKKQKKKRPSPILTFIFLICSIGYIVMNSESLIKFASQFISPEPKVTIQTVTVDPRLHTIGNLSSANLNFLNIQLGYDLSMLKSMEIEESSVTIVWNDIPDDIEARFNSTLSTNNVNDDEIFISSLQIVPDMKNLLFLNNKPIQSWIHYTYKQFPENESHIFQPIEYANTVYHPVTIQILDKSDILEFIKWLRNGPSNVLLRKSIITQQPDGHLSAVFYISLFDLG